MEHSQAVRHHVNQAQMARLSFLFLSLLSVVSRTHSYVITLDAGIENECFHERVPVGTKLGFSFEVIEGGFYDVDVVIKDPNNSILHQDDRASNGKFTIEANMDGPYQFCFNNKHVSYNPKVVIFDIDRSDVKSSPKADGTQKDDDVTKVLEMTDNLMLATISSRHDVRFLLARDRVHRKVNEETNSRIVWWSFLEFILLLSVTVGQVWYLKRFFEIRRKA